MESFSPIQYQREVEGSALPFMPMGSYPKHLYTLQIEDDGTIQDSPKDKQYIIEMNSEVRLRLRSGSPVARDAFLLVNKPKVTMQHHEEGKYHEQQLFHDTDFPSEMSFQTASTRAVTGVGIPHVEYTVTQPRQRITEKLNHVDMSTFIPSQAINLEADFIAKSYLTTEDEIDPRLTYKGSKLENRYLLRIKPSNRDLSVNLEFRVHFPEAGSFFIQFEYFDKDLEQRNYTDPIYINVEPVMLIRDKQVRVKELSILTVLSRCMGSIEQFWDSMFNNIAQLKYNAVHFAPIQKYGYSMSHYSIADQLTIDDFFFKGSNHPKDEPVKLSRDERISILKRYMDELKSEHGLLSIMDIVLNHTAGNSEWLLEHPEAAYNTKDCPHLTVAYILDKAVNEFSCDYANKRNMHDCPAAPFINNEGDLQAVIRALQTRVIPRLELQDFFMFNIDATMILVRKTLQTELRGKPLTVEFFKKKFDRLKLSGKDLYQVINEKYTLKRGAERNGVTLQMPHAVALAFIACQQNEGETVKKIEEIIKRHNNEWKGTVDGFMKNAINSFQGEIRYHKLEQGKKKITAENPIVERYFRELPNEEHSCVAHNGWIGNANPLEDFGMVGWHYLDRSINIWSDSVKLRFGDCPADSPYLWERMSQYVYEMAVIFDGFRLDNAHSTPIHVANYMLQVARSVNNNLFIMAELFTSNADIDAIFVRRLNINGLIREVQNTKDTKQLGEFFHQITCREAVVGQVDQDFEEVTTGEKYRVLKPRRPKEIIYDCTHDNPSPIEKFKTGRIALSHLGLISMSDITIASTWGYDQLLPKNISVISEKRLYSMPDQGDLFTYDKEDPNHHRLSHHQKEEYLEDAYYPDSHHPIITPELTPEYQEPTEYEHEFTILYNDAAKIFVAGEFNGWKPTLEMKRVEGERWSLKQTFPIIKGKMQPFMYKFVIDGKEWKVNDQQPKVTEKNGNVNNLLEIPGAVPPSFPKPREEAPSKKPEGGEWTFNDIRYARKKLNAIHEECTQNNAEIYLHQQSSDVLVITRQFSFDHHQDYDAYVSITRHCYFQEGGDYNYQTTVELPGLFQDVVFAGYLEMDPKNDFKDLESDPRFITSAKSRLRTFKGISKFCREENSNGRSRLVFHMMPPSFTLVVRTRSIKDLKEAALYFSTLQEVLSADLARQIFGDTTLAGFNHLLFRSEPEEKEISKGERGPYGLDKYGPMTYSGIASFMTIFRQLKTCGDMGHELFDNMRNGDWYIQYVLDRLYFMGAELKPVTEYMKEAIGYLKKLPMPLRPKYGSRIIEKLYNAAVYEITQVRMKDRFVNVNSEDMFIQRLALGVVQMWGRIPSAEFKDHKDTMSAGLPHFSTGFTRCWGRDTFISLKGLFLTTGLFEEAQKTIIQFARVLRHGGLIPNLHDSGNNTRFNARDATWFFFQAINDYFKTVTSNTGTYEEGHRFLKLTMIDLHFDQPKKLSLLDIMHQILQSHADGIKFREVNAGTQIDGQMRNEGFNVDIWLDRETGFLHGGNQFNCGTWMDKMGSSDKTGNKGIPATPRDGAPIELTALLYSSLRFMEELNDNEIIERFHIQVKDRNGNPELWTYKQWADRIKLNFERCYWVPVKPEEDQSYVIDRKLINRRGIYKDVFKSTHGYTDYQLRPNLCVAMAYAPDLFQEDHARVCVKNVEEILMEKNCMGIKTLDPSDKNYRGDYVNSDDSCGWNYHQGPEWLWPVGFFLKAKMTFGGYSFKDDLREDIMKWLLPHQKHIISESKWEGLPELTNSHGKHCPDSCASQAWSIATILDAVQDLHFR